MEIIQENYEKLTLAIAACLFTFYLFITLFLINNLRLILWTYLLVCLCEKEIYSGVDQDRLIRALYYQFCMKKKVIILDIKKSMHDKP